MTRARTECTPSTFRSMILTLGSQKDCLARQQPDTVSILETWRNAPISHVSHSKQPHSHMQPRRVPAGCNPVNKRVSLRVSHVAKMLPCCQAEHDWPERWVAFAAIEGGVKEAPEAALTSCLACAVLK